MHEVGHQIGERLDGASVRISGSVEQGWRLEKFRDGDASNYETFSPTTPLAVVKMLIVMSLLHGLSIASVDVGDAFLQVPQTPLVLIEVPLWALHSGEVGKWQKILGVETMFARATCGSFGMEQVLHRDL